MLAKIIFRPFPRGAYQKKHPLCRDMDTLLSVDWMVKIVTISVSHATKLKTEISVTPLIML